MVEAFPLTWPPGWKRTKHPEPARFNTARGKAINDLYNELRMLGATMITISTNIATYQRGNNKIPYANQTAEDTGVAVYFDRGGNQQCVPCDKWDSITDNIQAITKTVAALRGIERWGAKEMVDAAFSGFKALPSPEDVVPIKSYPQYFVNCIDEVNGREKYKELVKKLHPDTGGSAEEFGEMQRQWTIFKSKKVVRND